MIPTNATTIICGDFNLPSNRGLSRFSDVLVEKGFSQYVNSPTRGNNLLDLVFVNDDFAVSGVVVGPPFSTSDHNSVSFKLVYLVSSSLNSSQSRYRFDAESLKLICDDLKFVDWSTIFYTTDLETVWSNFSNILLNSVDKFADKIHVTPPIASGKSYPKSIKKLLSRKRTIWRSWQSNKNNVHLGFKYREIARECRLSIINYYANIETKIGNSNKIGSFYNYANKKLSCKQWRRNHGVSGVSGPPTFWTTGSSGVRATVFQITGSVDHIA